MIQVSVCATNFFFSVFVVSKTKPKGGHSCLQASGALKRASRGGMLVGSQLQAVARTLVGATRLQRSVMGASRAADGTGDYNLFSALTDRIKV